MKKHSVFAALLGAAVCLPLAGADSASAPKDDSARTLPLKNVTLYSSGVGAFVHEGEVTGRTKLDFMFREEQLNDLLKSLAVSAAGKVGIDSINYPSKLPLGELLRGYRVNLQGNTTLFGVLSQMRGADFQCKLSDGAVFTGRLLGVEMKSDTVASGADRVLTQTEYGVFVTSEGLRRVKLADLSSIRPTDPERLAELLRSLGVLDKAGELSDRKIEINLTSEGTNPVRIAYVIESPVWKTSYRLTLPEKNAEKAFLQSWALVENPTAGEWKNVALTLVSGRPSSFVQDLYSSIYLTRPEVLRENYSGLVPVRHETGVNAVFLKDDCDAETVSERFEPSPVSEIKAASFTSRKFTRASGTGGSAVTAPSGELFQYAIAKPVTLGSRESAMLELAAGPVDAEKITLYNAARDGGRPLSAVLLRNTTKLLLPQGPVTVFNGGDYAGDASLSDLAEGADQILSYGLDLELAALAESAMNTQSSIASARVSNGMLNLSVRSLRNRVYRFTNRAKTDKTVILEHALSGTLADGMKPFETTRNFVRFRVNVPAGKTVDFPVREVLDSQENYSLLQNDLSTVMVRLRNAELPKETAELLKKIFEINTNLKEAERTLADLNTSIADTDSAHERTRRTLGTVTANEYRNKLTLQLADLDKKLFDLGKAKEENMTRIREYKKALADLIGNAR